MVTTNEAYDAALSRRRLKERLHYLPAAVAKEASIEVRRQGERLAEAQRQEVDVVSGEAHDSIKVVPGRYYSDGYNTQVYVVAGGPTTTAHGYDHVRALEFGTVNNEAHPFFFPPYYRLRRSMYQAIKESMMIAVNRGKGKSV